MVKDHLMVNFWQPQLPVFYRKLNTFFFFYSELKTRSVFIDTANNKIF